MLLAAAVIAAAQATPPPGWELTQDDGDVVVYRRSVPGSPIKSVRGTGVVDAPVKTVALVLLDDARASEWVDSLAEARVVRLVNPLEYVEYNHASMPPLVSDRDFVDDVRMWAERDKKIAYIKSTPTTDASLPEKCCVRGVLEATYTLESIDGGKRTRLTVEINTDPKGWLPAWVVNFFQKDWAKNTIAGIRGQAKKPDLKPPPEFTEFFSQLDF